MQIPIEIMHRICEIGCDIKVSGFLFCVLETQENCIPAWEIGLQTSKSTEIDRNPEDLLFQAKIDIHSWRS
jgi:hypothetical protein